jgi:23S rRNA (adenine2503-C2)-methyltransferase
MGEPAHNQDAVLAALAALGGAGGFGHKNLVVSTVGDPRFFERLRAGVVRPALALSLHTTDAALRAELLPRAPRVLPRALLEHALDYADATGHPLQLQWTLVGGVNDGADELERLAGWIGGRRAIVNLIPLNPVDGLDLARTDDAQARELLAVLKRRGVLSKLRLSVASDVDGACGQLRARAARPA